MPNVIYFTSKCFWPLGSCIAPDVGTIFGAIPNLGELAGAFSLLSNESCWGSCGVCSLVLSWKDGGKKGVCTPRWDPAPPQAHPLTGCHYGVHQHPHDPHSNSEEKRISACPAVRAGGKFPTSNFQISPAFLATFPVFVHVILFFVWFS